MYLVIRLRKAYPFLPLPVYAYLVKLLIGKALAIPDESSIEEEISL
jgi:hypothetical protein